MPAHNLFFSFQGRISQSYLSFFMQLLNTSIAFFSIYRWVCFRYIDRFVFHIHSLHWLTAIMLLLQTHTLTETTTTNQPQVMNLTNPQHVRQSLNLSWTLLFTHIIHSLFTYTFLLSKIITGLAITHQTISSNRAFRFWLSGFQTL